MFSSKRSIFYLELLLLFILCAIVLHSPLLTSNGLPNNDLAADMLHGDLIKTNAYLLTGHYSLWLFHHPGPFWFYWNFLFESLALPLSRLNLWVLGSLIISSCFLIFSAIALSFYFFKKFHFLFCFFFIFILGVFAPDMQNIWMPCRIIAPYLAFLVCLLFLMRGQFNYIAPAVFFTCVLIHGYITMIAFTLPFLFVTFFIGLYSEKNLKQYKGIIFYSIFLALFFVSPIIIDYCLNHPHSNVDAILKVMNNQATSQNIESNGGGGGGIHVG